MLQVSDVDFELLTLLREAEGVDVGILIDYITDDGKGRVSLDSDICAKLVDARISGNYSDNILRLIAHELQLFGGNSIINLIRGGKGVSYETLLKDVADHLKAPYAKDAAVEEVELAILLKLMAQAWEKMTPEERRTYLDSLGLTDIPVGPAAMAAAIAAVRLGGFAAYRLALVIANSLARALLGRGLALGANAALMRGLGVLAGPVGWALTAIWTVFDLASPAYRVTIPCVVQLAYIRNKQNVAECSKCNSQVAKGAKFCAECGSPQ